MRRLLATFLFAVVLNGQTAPEVKDPLGRENPQGSVFRFLEACHAGDYSKATYYLDLRKLSPADRAKTGPELARQLEDLLDDTAFDISTLSRDPEGDQADDLEGEFDELATFHVDGKDLNMQLERIETKPGVRIWVVSAPSVALISMAHKIVAETPFEKELPQKLVTTEVFDTPVWRWIALVLMGAALWFLTGAFIWAVGAVFRSETALPFIRGPLRLCLLQAGFWGAMEIAPPASLARLFLDRLIEFSLFLGLAWAAAIIIDLLADRWHASLDPRINAVSYSVLPLGRQVLKMAFYLIAFLMVISKWGYNTSTIIAGLGVGGLAVALAAQKTIENLFGGISVIGDRPVLVGDVCRFDGRTGTVIHIGLRSTRLRTPDRTVISVPNSQFSSMTLENISGRDKIWFHPTLNLRRDTTSEQLAQVLASFQQVLANEPKVEVGKIPVRFVGAGAYSLDVEVAAYVMTGDNDEFLAIQQELLFKLLQAIEHAGTGLAVPLQENFEASKHA